MLTTSTMQTPIGPLTVVAQDDVVVAGGFTDDAGMLIARLPGALREVSAERVGRLGAISDALEAYFAGDVRALDAIAVRQRGGGFQLRVWDALRDIPPGHATTYAALAVQLGGQRLARAVGLGCATNLIAPIVPCHRVTGSDGSLRGYYWGLDKKSWLLEHERRHTAG